MVRRARPYEQDIAEGDRKRLTKTTRALFPVQEERTANLTVDFQEL